MLELKEYKVTLTGVIRVDPEEYTALGVEPIGIGKALLGKIRKFPLISLKLMEQNGSLEIKVERVK